MITTHIITEEEHTQLIGPNRPNMQRIFPKMNATEREQFITGICPVCWNNIFKKKKEN